MEPSERLTVAYTAAPESSRPLNEVVLPAYRSSVYTHALCHQHVPQGPAVFLVNGVALGGSWTWGGGGSRVAWRNAAMKHHPTIKRLPTAPHHSALSPCPPPTPDPQLRHRPAIGCHQPRPREQRMPAAVSIHCHRRCLHLPTTAATTTCWHRLRRRWHRRRHRGAGTRHPR